MLKRRRLYVLLFAVPALLVSLIAAALALAATAGMLWLFVFGDNPWPPVTDFLLGAVFIVIGTAIWVVLLSVAYWVGKQQEARPTLSTAHVALSIGATLALAAVLVMRLMNVGSFETKTDSVVCADSCRARGFLASGMPPRDSGDRTCSCYDAQGRETRRTPLSDVAPGARED